MTREEARQAIDYYYCHTELLDEYGDYCDQTEYEEAFDVAITALSNSENPNKWIPVSERLPEADEYVGDVAKYYLVQNKYGDMLVARYTHSEYWEQIYRNKPYADEVVAWMPLPEPYKVEREDKE